MLPTARVISFVFLPPQFLAEGGGLIYALENSTIPGLVVLVALFLASVLSWTVMITKFRMLNRAKDRRMDFLDAFRADRQPLSLYQSGARFAGAPVFAVYQAGCRELSFQMLGSAEVDETFAAAPGDRAADFPRADAHGADRDGTLRGRDLR